MKRMRRFMSAVLACMMLFSCMGVSYVAAAEENILFTADFSSVAEGAAPAKGAGNDQWTGILQNETKKLYVRGATENGNSVLQIGCEADGTKGGPCITRRVSFNGLDSVTLRFRTKAEDTKLAVLLTSDAADKTTTTTLWSGKTNGWADVQVDIDVKNKTVASSVNGEKAETKTLHDINDFSTTTFRFSPAPEPGQCVYIDDVVVSSPDTQVAGGGAVPETGTAAPEKLTVPANATVFLKTDFEDRAADLQIRKTTIFDNATSFTFTYKNGENMVMRYYADDGQTHGPCVVSKIPYAVHSFCVDYAVKPSNSRAVLELYSDGALNRGKIASVAASIAGVSATEWNYVHAEFDLDKGIVTGTINGNAFPQAELKAVSDLSTLQIRLTGQLAANDAMYYDNIAIYTVEKIQFDGPLRPNYGVDWSYVHPSQPLSESSYVNNLKEQHPRLLVRDWDAMREKINTSYEAKMMYNNIKALADSCLNSDAPEYKQGTTGNALAPARKGKDRLAALAFVYNIENDPRYLNDAYEEMVQMGEWQDWSATNAYLATGEIMLGYALAVDWLYNDLTQAQRDTIYGIVEKHALTLLVYHFEKPESSSFYNQYNWNSVCNAGTVGIALAFGDEHKEVCEYILENAMEFLTLVLNSYSDDGGFVEGTMYWNLGTTHIAYVLDMLDNAFADGFTLPERYQLSSHPGFANTGDFAIYFNGTAGRFNFGDATLGMNVPGVLYWLASRYDKPEYTAYMNSLQSKVGWQTGSHYTLQGLIAYAPEHADADAGSLPLDRFFVSDEEKGFNGISMRSTWDNNRALYAGMQGGYNGVSHLYLSLGTYVIDYHHKRFIKQLGEYSYNLSGGKETIYYKRAEGNNMLVINPSAEPDQLTTTVRLTRSGTSENTAFGILDMTQTNNDYVFAQRGMMMTDQRRRVLIQDEVTAKEASEFYWFANTDAAISIAADGQSAILELEGEKMLVRIVKAPAGAKFDIAERVSVVEGVQNTVSSGNKLFIHMEDVTKLELCVEYVGLEKGEGIPKAWNYVPMAQWTADDNRQTSAEIAASATEIAASATVLKLDTPHAIANGEKTYVDPANYDVVPFTENDRTLVPVRFISESFGAKVGWDDATQTVSVNYEDKAIQLVIGSNQMLVNGAAVTLDTPANTYNDRTLIPLRALSEALDKYVFWDDRGLIIISDYEKTYSEEEISRLMTELNVSVSINGKEMTFFDTNRTNYTLDVKSGEAVPEIGISTIGEEVVSVTQASAVGESAVLTIGDKIYTILMQEDAFENIKSNKDPGVMNAIKVSLNAMEKPSYNTFIYVEDLLDSTGFATYPVRGIVDGVINEEIPNRWAANGDGQWIMMDFGTAKNVYSMAFAGVYQYNRSYDFDVLVSTDGENWTTVHTGGAPQTTEIMSIIPLGGVDARYVKLVGHGSNVQTWNTWAEVRFYESAAQQAEDVSYWPVYFADDSVHGKVGETKPLIIKGVDSEGAMFDLSSEATVKYELRNPTIARVDESGNITFLLAGTTTMTVIATQDGYTKRATVTVTCE